MSNGSKKCSKCGQVKSLDEFYRCSRASDGRQSACKRCQKSTLNQVRYQPDPSMTSKQCSRCRQTKPVAEFHRQQQAKDGLQSACKSCRSAVAARAYESEEASKRARRTELTKRWRRLNPGAVREAARRYRENNSEKRRAQFAAWAAKNRDRLKEYERTRVRKPQEREARRRANKKWRQRNKDALRVKQREWRARNRQQAREQVQRRRALKAAAPAFTLMTRDLSRLTGAACIACGAPADSLDHIIPLSRGGSHGVGNLAPMCRTCNSSKGAKTVTEWRKANDWLPLGSFPRWKDRADGAA